MDRKQREIDIQSRLAALEFMVAQLFYIYYAQTRATDEFVAEQRAIMRRFASHLTVSGAGDAAMTDHMTAEVGDRIDDILATVGDIRELHRNSISPKG
jgi:hypothetical protein